MTIYSRYAEIYDDTNQIAFSLRMVPYLDQLLARHPLAVRSALDLACGTGTAALCFAAKGWESYGVDGSAEMLACARQKLAEAEAQEGCSLAVAFSQQDMRHFLLPHPVDLITCL